MKHGALLLVLMVRAAKVAAHCRVDFEYGCYSDENSHRTLSGPQLLCQHGKDNATIPPGCSMMTRTMCAQWCHNQQMDIAGVEYGGQCFCDKVKHKWTAWKAPKHSGKPLAPEPASDCRDPCKGDRKTTCGGFSRIEVYNFTCTGPPDPTPPPQPPPPPPPAVYPHVKPCDKEPLKSSKACDPAAALQERVGAIIQLLPEDELWAMYSDQSAGSPTLNIPFYNWWSEALHGVSRCPYQKFLPKEQQAGGSCCALAADGTKKCPTSFPAGITTSASFNRTLFRDIGTAVGTEA